MAEGVDEAGRRNVHNPVPEQDIEKAFLNADRNYPSESPHWQENAIRYQELLTEEAKKQEEKDGAPPENAGKNRDSESKDLARPQESLSGNLFRKDS